MDTTGRLTFEICDAILVVTFDPLGRSFHCRWSRDSVVVVEIFREGAVRLQVRSSGPENYIAVDFETDSEQGRLELKVSRFRIARSTPLAVSLPGSGIPICRPQTGRQGDGECWRDQPRADPPGAVMATPPDLVRDLRGCWPADQ